MDRKCGLDYNSPAMQWEAFISSNCAICMSIDVMYVYYTFYCYTLYPRHKKLFIGNKPQQYAKTITH